MELTRRNLAVYVLLAAVWVVMAAWQAEEHFRFRAAAKADLRSRSKDIANTVSACVRGLRSRGTVVLQERLEPVLDEMINGRSNELVQASELLGIALLNAAEEPIASAGRPIDFSQKDILQQGEHWGVRSVTFANPVDLGASVLPPIHELTNTFHEGGPISGDSQSNALRRAAASTPAGSVTNQASRTDAQARAGRPRGLRGMIAGHEAEFRSLLEKRALHGLVIAMSTEAFEAASTRDFWLRTFIVALAAVSAAGGSVAWRNLVKSSDLQIRLVRASELNTHLKEMNLAAAGLAHETRNPLNIIRGLAQMISKQPQAAPEIRDKSLDIISQSDKVAAQLNEFINYSRPREVRRSVLALGSVVNEVVRTLNYDLEEKKIQLHVKGDPLSIEADEQLLRQALFNLLLNAIQAVDGSGEIQIVAERRSASEGVLEVRDNGPGVPPERRSEVFKPYFTTQTQGTGLGLAVVQQIVLAHGWEIECQPNEPKGAVFRIRHLKVTGA